MRIKFEIDTSKFDSELKKWQKNFDTKAEKMVIEAGKEDIEEVARSNLHAGGHVDTTRLVNSLYTSSYGNTSHRYTALPYSARYRRRMKQTSFSGNLSVKPKDRKEVVVGSATPYSHYIHRICTPYLLSAMEQARPKFIQRLKGLLK